MKNRAITKKIISLVTGGVAGFVVTVGTSVVQKLLTGVPVLGLERYYAPAVIGVVVGVVLAVVITRLKASRSEHAHLSAVVEQATQQILIADTTGVIAYVNPSFVENTGYTREEANSLDLFRQAECTGDGLAPRGMWETISAGRVWSGGGERRRKDGTSYHARVQAFPIHDRSGEISAFAAICTDVSSEHELQEYVRQTQKLEAVGRLVGGIAHDFNNLLTVINGYCDIALGNMRAEGDPKTRHAMEMVKRAGGQATGLVAQLLTFSHNQKREDLPFDVNDVLESMSKMIRRFIGEDISFSVEPARQLPVVRGDRGQFEQVFMNLVINARDAIAAGQDRQAERRITISTGTCAKGEECPEGLLPGTYVEICVADTGVGMDAGTCEQIFEPFFTTKVERAGTGLGLATVHGIMQQNHGHISVKSEKGKGSEFTVLWPASASSSTAPADTDVPVRASSGTETVLVVEDSEAVRSFTVGALELYGYRVISAEDGSRALNVAMDCPGGIDLVVSDAVLPDTNGPELIERLRLAFPDIQAVLVSGYAEADLADSFRVPDDVGMVMKPYDAAAIADAARAALDDRAQTPG